MQRFEEIIKLIELTGDKLVVLDKENTAYVVMKFDDYKAMSLAKAEILEKTKKFPNFKSNPGSLLKKSENIRPIPLQKTNVKEFEIMQKYINNQDVYYPEPLIE